ncbi:NADH:ubiquinone reductase (Na(+)-transporting) subunit A [Psittacicella melopsittaci]|uniref:Na(+)-translocating NADH-quinone reductase subunit A n=1 Tax=Psittacicella melopsittaci TaxID=2028576 RepID=A0A3A1Y751_9GAMM|nr:Na(+)-translocating NADH-quinone reductase subunit A [Psittacicella melopsittaci]RIY33048.1 NADH:ubiquinone reductase (Na(+)-transporting) subunit A [Psittacicella melopsittaci]
MITIKKGLDLPLAGNPDQVIHNDVTVNEVAVVGSSFNNLKPTVKVREGDHVKKGEVILTDKKYPSIAFTSPVNGTVKVINRGERRVFQSLVIDVDKNSDDNGVSFTSYTSEQLKGKSEELKEQLLKSGLWVSLRTRPFNNLADPDFTPNALFVNAHDTNPGHADPDVVLKDQAKYFNFGLEVLAEIFAQVPNKFVVGGPNFSLNKVPGFTYEQFKGVHPAGLVGTHIHFLSPVSLTKVAYHLNYQDVISIGKLFANGYLDGTKVIALSGPQVNAPTLYRVPYGASVLDVTFNKLKEGTNRIVSGSALDGVKAADVFGYLGQYDLQLTVLEEGYKQEFIGWFAPQPKKFSLSRLNFFGKKDLPLTTSTNGSSRGMVPIGLYERVMPLDIYPTLLLRDIISGDTDSAQDLGVLELAEEDIALCSFVCQGKYDYALYLRQALNKIEKEG